MTAAEVNETSGTTEAPEEPSITFDDLGLPENLLAAVKQLGFTKPSTIQERAIPELLKGSDITGIAQTGTGKTAAFGLPMLAALDPELRAVQALVLAPTRELAMQVAEAIETFASHVDGLEVLAVYGGSPYPPQIRALKTGVQVVVGTPGRVIDHLDRGTLDLSNIRFLVLDEADEMLRMGFAEDVERVFGEAPAERQVALFSATMPPQIRRVAQHHLKNPVEIAVARQSTTVTSVTQEYAIVPFRHKSGSLFRVLATSDADAAIVFCRTRGAAEEVGSALIERGISAATISGDVAQKDREKIVERLRSGQLDVLVATDVAARGLDVERIGLVVNFDIPGEPEAYVHRIGRTGRAGRSGRALSFVTPSERSKLKFIERTIRTNLTEIEIPSPADVSEHKVKKMLGSLETRIEAGRLAMYEKLITTYLEEHETENITVAAALAAIAVGDSGPRARAEQEEYENQLAEDRRGRKNRDERESRFSKDRPGRFDRDRGDRGDRGDRSSRDRGGRRDRDGGSGTRYRIAVGHKDGAEARGIVGALTNEGGLSGRDLGRIEIFGSFSLVDISASVDEDMMGRISRARVGGKALRIRLDDGPAPRSGGYDRDRGGDRGDRPRFDRDRGGDRGGYDRGGDRRGRNDWNDRSDRSSFKPRRGNR
ncbi:DEAD/DEAH box helicase [Timonella senegalensis]|uniref:DEAD/DEAH box helicase n=2 Tax=Timonella senegalensis TaxID=1465825 RepID=UPI002FE18373